MKITRSSKCYFSWLTAEKKAAITEFLAEANKVVYYCIDHHEQLILNGARRDYLVLKHNLQPVISWLTERAKKNCFQETFGLITGTKQSSEELKKEYKTPTHDPNRLFLSCTNVKINMSPNLKDFDMLVELCSFDSRKRNTKIAIPLKRTRVFNKYAAKGKLATSVLLTNKYIQFSFEIEVPKKVAGDIVGFDPGAVTALTDDEGNKYGSGFWLLLEKLKRKKRCSSAWYRCREEIKEFIDKTVKQIPFSKLEYLILEDNKKIRYKSKIKRRTTAVIRSVLAGWVRSRIDNRIEMLAEEHGVRFRRVPAFNNSTTCPACGCCEKANRATQSEFRCVACGHTTNADAVGALNSLARFALGNYGSECKQRFVEKHSDYFRNKELV